MEDKPIYQSYTSYHEIDVDVVDTGVMIYEAEVGSINYADIVWLTRSEAIAAAKAILAYYGEE